MSKLKLRLAGLAFIGLSLLVAGAHTASADCIDVVLYGTNPATGECKRVDPCNIPSGWTVSSQECPVVG